MNDIRFQTKTKTALSPDQSQFLTRELERLWLLSALRVGLEQAANSETVLADAAFFDGMQSRFFGNQVRDQERVIQA